MKKSLKYFWDKNKYFLVSVSFVLTALAIWQLVTVIFKVDYYVLPKFSDVATEFFKLFAKSKFYKDLLGTVGRALLSVTLAILFGIIVGVFAINKYVRACLTPVVACVKSLPVMAITLIMLLIFGKAYAPIIIGFLMAFPIIYNNTILGIDGIDTNLLEMASVYKVSRKNKLFKICLPQTLPSVFSGIETAGGMCIKAVISAEILCFTINSLGFSMYVAKSNGILYPQEAALLFAYCLVAILLSLIIELIVKLFAKGVLKWR